MNATFAIEQQRRASVCMARREDIAKSIEMTIVKHDKAQISFGLFASLFPPAFDGRPDEDRLTTAYDAQVQAQVMAAVEEWAQEHGWRCELIDGDVRFTRAI